MFSGQCFFLSTKRFTLSEESSLRTLLAQNGGILSTTFDPDTTILVVKDPNDENFLSLYRQYKFTGEKCPVVGLKCIEESVAQNKPLPDDLPVFSRVLEDLTICITGFTDENNNERETIIRHLKWMCGGFTTFLSKDTTHLIADRPGSAKYKAAVSRKLPIVTKEWIARCLRQNTRLPEKPFLLPIFNQLKISMSGIAQPQRSMLAKIIESNGAVYSPSLDEACTHLVVDVSDFKISNPENLETGERTKYHHALMWDIKVIGEDWVYECVRRKACLPEDDFPLNVNPKIFKGCFIWLIGFSETDKDNLRAIVSEFQLGGGETITDLTVQKPTHIVVTPSCDLSSLQVLEKLESPVLSYEWLNASVSTQELAPLEPFLLSKKDSSISIQQINIDQSSDSNKDDNRAPPLLFQNLNFLVLVRNQGRKQVKDILQLHGGDVYFAEDLENNANTPPISYSILEPHPLAVNPSIPQESRPVTTIWMEQCISENKVLYPGDEIVYSQLPYKQNYYKSIMQEVCIYFSGSLPSQTVILSQLLGAKKCARITTKTTHVVSLDISKDDLETLRRIPSPIAIVTPAWLLECARGGYKPNEIDYALHINNFRKERVPSQIGETSSEGSQSQQFRSHLIEDFTNEGSTTMSDDTLDQTSPELKSILQGQVVAFSKVMQRDPQYEYYRNLAGQMGANYSWVLDSHVTHYIHQGKAESGKSFKEAVANPDLHIVSPQWLINCFEKKERASESIFPYTLNPSRALSFLQVGPPSKSVPKKAAPVPKPKKRTASQPKPSKASPLYLTFKDESPVKNPPTQSFHDPMQLDTPMDQDDFTLKYSSPNKPSPSTSHNTTSHSTTSHNTTSHNTTSHNTTSHIATAQNSTHNTTSHTTKTSSPSKHVITNTPSPTTSTGSQESTSQPNSSQPKSQPTILKNPFQSSQSRIKGIPLNRQNSITNITPSSQSQSEGSQNNLHSTRIDESPLSTPVLQKSTTAENPSILSNLDNNAVQALEELLKQTLHPCKTVDEPVFSFTNTTMLSRNQLLNEFANSPEKLNSKKKRKRGQQSLEYEDISSQNITYITTYDEEKKQLLENIHAKDNERENGSHANKKKKIEEKDEISVLTKKERVALDLTKEKSTTSKEKSKEKAKEKEVRERSPKRKQEPSTTKNEKRETSPKGKKKEVSPKRKRDEKDDPKKSPKRPRPNEEFIQILEKEIKESKKNKANPKIFEFASIDKAQVSTYENVVKKLGGQIGTQETFTHLIAAKPKRSTKFMCALAAGKWILKPSYLADGYKKNKFLSEADYEWNENDKLDDESNPEVLKAPKRCREMVARNQGKPLFLNWKVVLLCAANRQSEFEVILRTGGATIVPYNRSKPAAWKDVKYAFLDPIKNDEAKFLKQEKVVCLNTGFLAEYLVRGANEDKFLVKD